MAAISLTGTLVVPFIIGSAERHYLDLQGDINRRQAEALARFAEYRLAAGVDKDQVVGVIGKRKFSYDLWGDVVNVASRMESARKPGRIHVTEAVRQRLAGRFRWDPRPLMDIKGKGRLQTFFLAGLADKFPVE